MKMFKIAITSVILLLFGITAIVQNPYSDFTVIIGMLLIAAGILVWIYPIHFEEIKRRKRHVELVVVKKRKRKTSRKRRKK
jgi:accessory gene regulator protein AgrB